MNDQQTKSAQREARSAPPAGSAILRVVGYTEREGMLWDMVCQNDTLGTITVDPWVGCALEQMTDDEKRALIGKEFVMRDFWQHSSGVWLCHVFSPNVLVSDGADKNKP